MEAHGGWLWSRRAKVRLWGLVERSMVWWVCYGATSLRLRAMMMVANNGSDDDSDRNSSSSMFVKGEEEKIVKWR
ncbi:uncharacterized protein G2W53_040198 [Senna tora]|uniref:Uncharacterized protein n=1 Tax=Senna tora TaxID=362788 RepID=A0A834SUK3_9FABA|nr:uncharacterized protein G2W53_040198 [Senna tora]